MMHEEGDGDVEMKKIQNMMEKATGRWWATCNECVKKIRSKGWVV